MTKAYQLLEKEHVASIREIQKNPSKALKGITRVMRGNKTIGFFFSNEEFDEILEDIEAISSKTLQKRVKKAREEIEKGEVYSHDEIMKEYGL